jgi:uncharacterized membrane protein YhaH (DUF805 family)
MSGQTDWVELLMSSTGRIARMPFLIAGAGLIAITALYESVAGTALHLMTGWFVYPTILFAAACILSKRLHDRGRSGWWAAPILIGIIAILPTPTSFFDFLFGVLVFWATIELAVMPGEEGGNRFGPNPVNPLSDAAVL